MSLWTCPDHGLTGPRACCEKASRVFNVVEPPTDGATTAGESLLSAELRAAIARVDADCLRLAPGSDKRLATLDDILAATPEQGTDLPRDLCTAMFGNGYLLSHERRLLAITLARALPEVERLRSQLAEREQEIERLRGYARHKGTCIVFDGGRCSCGLDDARSPSQPEPPQ